MSDLSSIDSIEETGSERDTGPIEVREGVVHFVYEPQIVCITETNRP